MMRGNAHLEKMMMREKAENARIGCVNRVN